MRTKRRVVCCLFLAMSNTACMSIMADAQGGFSSSTRLETNRMGGAAQVAVGMNIGDKSAHYGGPGAAARLKISEKVREFALAPHAYFFNGSMTSPYGRVGFHLLQLGEVDESFAFGMGSPYAEIGFRYRTFVVSANVEYALRFTRQPHEGTFGLMVGWGFGGSTKHLSDKLHK